MVQEREDDRRIYLDPENEHDSSDDNQVDTSRGRCVSYIICSHMTCPIVIHVSTAKSPRAY